MAWDQKNQIPEDVWKALNNLRDNESFKIVIEWLRHGLKEEDIKLRRLSGEENLRTQGRSQILESILDINDSAVENLRLIKTSTNESITKSAFT